MKHIHQIIFIFSLFITCLSHAMLTPLHQTARCGKLMQVLYDIKMLKPLHQAAKDGNLKQVGQFLDAGANVNEDDFLASSPLHWAAYCGNAAIVKLLLNAGANVNAANLLGWTPLNMLMLNAAISDSAKIEVARLLIIRVALIKTREKQMLAFLMASHPRLGVGSPANALPKELFQYIWEFVKPTIEEADNFEENLETQQELAPQEPAQHEVQSNRSWLSNVWFQRGVAASAIAGLGILGYQLFKRR